MDVRESGGRLENQGRPSVLNGTSGWLVSPAFDLLFVANLAWLILLLPGFATDSGTAIDFWQVYFITLPHRWMTLLLVAVDPDRRGSKSSRLGLIATVAALLVAGIYFGTGGLTCLAIVDFAWNAWHFGAQHAGILRMYSLKAKAAPSQIERWGVRLFVSYALLRTASWATGWAAGSEQFMQSLRLVDLAMFLLPIMVIVQSVIQRGWTLARAIYRASVLFLYSGILLATTFEDRNLLIPLLVGSAMFHATEYLAIITIYANKRESVGSPGSFRLLAKHWLGFLAIFVVSLGTLGILLESNGFGAGWLAVNTWAAFVHYAFDGMIWKLRIPSTAQALGATP